MQHLTYYISGGILSIGFLAIGAVLGYLYRDIREQLERLTKELHKPKPETGPTPGSYQRANENKVNSDKATGPVTPKTPMLLEFEEQQRIMKMQENVHGSHS